ncbi:homing endonuclease [Staphylococcus phage Machias]|nr:homing endonuclease [Staphylococcus phage Machias]
MINMNYKPKNKKKITNEDWKEIVKELGNDEYEVLGDYLGTKNKIEMKHKICGETFFMTPNNFKISENRCPICSIKKVSEKRRKKTKELNEKIKEVLDDSYEFKLNGNETVHNKIKVKHKQCGNEYSVLIRHIIYDKNKCSKCQDFVNSRDEKEINKFLIEMGVDFERQYKFEDDKVKNLRFDFAVFKNNEIKLIEFDGEFHFKEKFGGPKAFEKVVYNDYLKNKFCFDNNIKLLRIPYWESNNKKEIIKRFIE